MPVIFTPLSQPTAKLLSPTKSPENCLSVQQTVTPATLPGYQPTARTGRKTAGPVMPCSPAKPDYGLSMLQQTMTTIYRSLPMPSVRPGNFPASLRPPAGDTTGEAARYGMRYSLNCHTRYGDSPEIYPVLQNITRICAVIWIMFLPVKTAKAFLTSGLATGATGRNSGSLPLP